MLTILAEVYPKHGHCAVTFTLATVSLCGPLTVLLREAIELPSLGAYGHFIRHSRPPRWTEETLRLLQMFLACTLAAATETLKLEL